MEIFFGTVSCCNVFAEVTARLRTFILVINFFAGGFENVKIGFNEPKEAFLFKTPVDGLEFIDCDFGNCTGVPTDATGLIDL